MANFKHYEVTVTPKHQAYAGTWSSGTYTVTVYAKDRADAIKQVRKQRRDEEGRFGCAASYAAKLAEESEQGEAEVA